MILSKKLEEDKIKQIGTEGRPCTLQKIMYTTVMLINVDGGVGFVFSFRIYLFVRCYEFNLHVKLWYKKDEYYLVEKLAMGDVPTFMKIAFDPKVQFVPVDIP